jgi:hypothetical protein
MELGEKMLREKDSMFVWQVYEGDIYNSKTALKNIEDLIIHLNNLKEKGFTHVNTEIIGIRFLTKSEVLLEEIEYLNNRVEQLKKELDGIR